MFATWISRFLAVIFLFEVLFPVAPVQAAPRKKDALKQAVDARVREQVENQACVPQPLADEKLRAADPFRQTKLAQEIVCKHQQGAKGDSKDGFAARGRKMAQELAGPLQVEIEAISESTSVPRPLMPVEVAKADSTQTTATPSAAQPASKKDPFLHETTRIAAGFKTTILQRDSQALFEQWVIQEIEERIKSPDFTFADLIDFIDPYEPSGYDPVVTTVAADALNIWLQFISTNFLEDENVLEGIAFYASEIEQRALYRLAFLESKHSLEKRPLHEAQAIGSLRIMLWSLHQLEYEILTNHKDIYSFYNKDTIFSKNKDGKSIGAVHFNQALNEISTVGATLNQQDPGAANFSLASTLVTYAVMLGFLRDQSGLLQDKNGVSLGKDRWNSVGNVLNRLELLTKRERYSAQTPFGNYLQASSVLFSTFAASVQQNIAEKDLEGARGTHLINMLKKAANFSTQSTPSVVTATELVSFLIRERGLKLSIEDRQYFANALESVYCRSSVGLENDLFNKGGVKQNLGKGTSKLPNKAEIRFESFGFDDIKQHTAFMQGLAKIHQAFGTPRSVLKPVDRQTDRLIIWEGSGESKNLQKQTQPLPNEDLYFRCQLSNTYDRNEVLVQREVGRAMGAVLVEILVWVAFDGVFRIVGKFISPIFRSGIAGIQALPKAISAAGKAARNGRLAGLAAGGREIRDAVQLAGKMAEVDSRAGTILAVSTKAKPSAGSSHALVVAGKGAQRQAAADATSVRAWSWWTDPRNRNFFGFGTMRRDVESVILSQGKNSVVVDMRALGLQRGIHSLGDWNKMIQAAAEQGFTFEPLSGAALRAARADAYMTAVAAQRIASQNWLTSHLPGATKYWKYVGKEGGWVRVTQKEFMEMHEAALKAQIKAAGSASKATQDYYQILGVARDASQQEIKQAYKRQAVLHHTDRHIRESAEQLAQEEAAFKKVAEAYEVLKNPAKRAEFDRALSAGIIGLTEDASGHSLAITFGGEAFNGTNGLAFGISSPEAADLVGAVRTYMQEHELFTPFELNFAKLPRYWQGSYYGVTRMLPLMYGADYLLKSRFDTALKDRVETEQKEVLAPLQEELDEVTQHAQEQRKEQNLPEAKPSLYETVSSTEPLVGKWYGMPYLSFAGASLGLGLYAAWSNLLEPFSPWKLHLINKENREILWNNARYSIASSHTQGALQERLTKQATDHALQPLRIQEETYLAQIQALYKPEVVAEIKGYWDSYIQETENLLTKKMTEEEQNKEFEKLNARFDRQLQRAGVLAQLEADRENLMAQAAAFPPETQKQLAQAYDNYIREVKGILAKENLTHERVEKLIKKAGERVGEKLQQISSASLAMPIGGGSVPQNLEEAAAYFEYDYQTFLARDASVYSPQVQAELEAYQAPAKQQIERIVADSTLSVEEKQTQIAAVEQDVFARAQQVLLVREEPDYNLLFDKTKQSMVSTMTALGSAEEVVELNTWLTQRRAEMERTLAKLATKDMSKRKETMTQFFTKLNQEYMEKLEKQLRPETETANP